MILLELLAEPGSHQRSGLSTEIGRLMAAGFAAVAEVTVRRAEERAAEHEGVADLGVPARYPNVLSSVVVVSWVAIAILRPERASALRSLSKRELVQRSHCSASATSCTNCRATKHRQSSSHVRHALVWPSSRTRASCAASSLSARCSVRLVGFVMSLSFMSRSACGYVDAHRETVACHVPRRW